MFSNIVGEMSNTPTTIARVFYFFPFGDKNNTDKSSQKNLDTYNVINMI